MRLPRRSRQQRWRRPGRGNARPSTRPSTRRQGRAASRPEPLRRRSVADPAVTAPAQPSPIRRRRLTTRAIVLAAVVCALALSVSYPLRQYVAEHGRITALEQDNARRQAQVSALEKRKKDLTDPAYIRSEARRRLQYVMPGDTAFVVVTKGRPAAPGPAARSLQQGQQGPWYSQLWDSVQRADQAH